MDKYKQVSSIRGNFFYNVQNASQELPREFGSMSKCPELESEDGNFGEAKISQYIISILPFVLFCSCDDSKMWIFSPQNVEKHNDKKRVGVSKLSSCSVNVQFFVKWWIPLLFL